MTSKETKALRKIRTRNENVVKRGYKWPNVIVAFIFAGICLYLATWTRYDLIVFIMGVAAFFSLGYVIFMPYEAYKDIRRARAMINRLEGVLKSGVVEVTPVKALRVALAKEYKDEGDLYIVELEDRRVLYICDHDHNLRKGFPCLEFELYSDEFHDLIGRLINPLSEKIKPIIIEPEAKAHYMKKAGFPGHMDIQKKEFDRLMEKMAPA